MTKQTLVNVSGTWKKVKVAWLNVSGVWKKVTPKGNINGIWKEFIQYSLALYKNGIAAIPFSGSSFIQRPLYLELSISTSYGSSDSAYLSTNNMIDITNYKTLRFVVETSCSNVMNNASRTVGFSTSNSGYLFDVSNRKNFYNTTGEQRATYTLDVSSLSGMFYFKVRADDSEAQNKTIVKIHEVILE